MTQRVNTNPMRGKTIAKLPAPVGYMTWFSAIVLWGAFITSSFTEPAPYWLSIPLTALNLLCLLRDSLGWRHL